MTKRARRRESSFTFVHAINALPRRGLFQSLLPPSVVRVPLGPLSTHAIAACLVSSFIAAFAKPRRFPLNCT